MKWIYVPLILMFFLASCASDPASMSPGETAPAAEHPSQNAALSELPDLGPAPELTNQTWINTDQPLRLADLRGQVVLLEMWTFG